MSCSLIFDYIKKGVPYLAPRRETSRHRGVLYHITDEFLMNQVPVLIADGME